LLWAVNIGGDAEAEKRDDFEFNPDHRLVAEWVDRRVSELVGFLVDGTREGIERAWEDIRDFNPDEAAEVVLSLIGLTAPDVESVVSFYLADTEKILVSKAGPAEVKSLADEKLLARAERMARYEARHAVNAGAEQMWEQAVELKQVRRNNVVRIWITSGGPRVCPDCQSMAGAEAALGGVWDTPRGTVSSPSLIHPDCYCTEDIRER
jgi:hypothetical protein